MWKLFGSSLNLPEALNSLRAHNLIKVVQNTIEEIVIYYKKVGVGRMYLNATRQFTIKFPVSAPKQGQGVVWIMEPMSENRECKGCFKKFKSKQALDAHREKACMITNNIFGVNQSLSSKAAAMDILKKMQVEMNSMQNEISSMHKEIKDLRQQIPSVAGVKRGRKNQTDLEKLNSNPGARPKVTLSELIKAAEAVDMGKCLKRVIDMSLSDAMTYMLREAYDNSSNVDASGKRCDDSNVWFPILHKLKKKFYFVYDVKMSAVDVGAEDASDAQLYEWKIVTDSALRSLIEKLHARLRTGYFAWRDAKKALLDTVDRVGKEDFIFTLKIIKYGSDLQVTSSMKDMRDWITLRTDKCVDMI